MEYTDTALAVNQTLGICTTIVTVVGGAIFLYLKHKQKKMEQVDHEQLSNKLNTELIVDEKEKKKIRLSSPNGFGYVEFYADLENIDLLIEQLEAHQKTITKLRNSK